MPDESQIADGEISSTEGTQVEKPVETGSGASPTPQVQDHSGEIRAMREQLDRMKDDLDRERETSRLLASYQQQSKPKHDDTDDEYRDVDKTLGPWLEKRLKPYVENVSKVLTDYYDKMDEFGYLAELINADPELSEKLNPGIAKDEIDRYRMKVAQTEGRYIKRADALGILRGMKSITEEKKSKSQKKQQAVVDESIRQAAVEATQSGETKPSHAPSGGGGKGQAALEKLRSGAHLTDEERAEARKELAKAKVEI